MGKDDKYKNMHPKMLDSVFNDLYTAKKLKQIVYFCLEHKYLNIKIHLFENENDLFS